MDPSFRDETKQRAQNLLAFQNNADHQTQAVAERNFQDFSDDSTRQSRINTIEGWL